MPPTAPDDESFALDPFADWVFHEPRQPHASVAGLNDRALGRLLAQFKRLTLPTPAPGQVRRLSEPAPLVVSPQPGYGKSHLLGRLFAALEGRATLIYVAPFQSPGLCWQSILLRTIQELAFPDRADPANTILGEPATQLDAFAHGVLAHLVAALIESGKAEHADPAGAAAWLRERPLESFALADPAHPWSHWLRTVFEGFHHEMEVQLRRAGVVLQSPGWLRVLLAYAASRPGDEVRALCHGWLSGQTLEPAEAARLGLRAGESTPADLPDQINELCWRRLLDFCQLAGFYRPFVFCFDQTEAYGHSPVLARSFGTAVAQLHLSAANQMLVITANQQPWEETVARYLENADKDRFAPLPLEGLNRAQGEELIRLRCRQWELSGEIIAAFFGDGHWLEERFPTGRNRMGTRQFLQVCSARWNQPEGWCKASILPAGIGKSAAPVLPTLTELLDRYTEDALGKPQRLGYNPDALRWLVEDAARGRTDFTPAANAGSPRGYLPVVWSSPGGKRVKVFLGFEPGDNWKRWRAILQEARTTCAPGRDKAVLFRTSEQAAIPGERWAIAEEIAVAKRSFFDLIELDQNMTAELYAARTLYLDAVAGDLPYRAEDVQAFLSQELDPFWQRIRQMPPPAAEPAPR